MTRISGFNVEMQTSFFLNVTECGRGYMNVRDKPDCAEYKDFVESLWKIYKPYADKHFQTDAAMHFQERFWEMYIGGTFLDHGFSITRGGDKGPEFCLSNTLKKIWIEAIAPGPGCGPDAYDLPKQQGDSFVAYNVPTDEIILRLRHAVEEKKRKYENYVAEGVISADDAYIIAINSKRIDTIVLSADLPNIVKSVYPFGSLTLVLDRETLDIKDKFYDNKSTIIKKSGSPVSTSIFFDDDYAGISAVIYSDVDCANKPLTLGADFVLVHNARATNKLDLGTLKFGDEYWLGDNNTLNWKNWNDTSSSM